MATLNPLGLLLLYLALSAAPESAQKAAVHVSEFNRFILSRTADGWWTRVDDLGNPIYHKREGPELLTRTYLFNVKTTDLSLHFDLTGNEDWSDSHLIRCKPPPECTVEILRAKQQLTATIRRQRKIETARIDWTPASQEQSPVAGILAGLEELPFEEFLEASYRRLQRRDPDNLYTNGFAELFGVVLNEQFTNLSAKYLSETQQLESGILDLLRTYERNTLSTDQQISYDAFEWYLDIQVRGHAYSRYRFLVNPVWGIQNLPVDFLMEYPLENKHDAKNYIARLAGLDRWVDQVIERLVQSAQAGAIPPKYVLEDTITQIDSILNLQERTQPDAKQIEVYTNFRRKILQMEGISEDARESLLEAAQAEVENTFIPAYQTLKDHLKRLTTTAIEDPNQWRLPGGDDYYAYLLAYYTGTDLSADDIHILGLAEVDRIQKEIQVAATISGLPADIRMAELNQRISDKSLAITGQALLKKYEQILAAADEAARAYFDLRPDAAVVIRPVPDGPFAFYDSPDPGSDVPGEMRTNPEFNPLRANYNEHVLVHHETIPGHHTQIALAQELEVPSIQRYYIINPYLQDYAFQAYVEGWACYAEILAYEMGLYDGEPLANLGRLRLQLFRIARVVADTGIHVKGWTLDEAAVYLEEVTGMAQNRTRMSRYLVNPGYPSGYNFGWFKILEMRQHAREQLGDDFDIRKFHNAILQHGILPIGVLEGVVDDWIAVQRDSSRYLQE